MLKNYSSRFVFCLLSNDSAFEPTSCNWISLRINAARIILSLSTFHTSVLRVLTIVHILHFCSTTPTTWTNILLYRTGKHASLSCLDVSSPDILKINNWKCFWEKVPREKCRVSGMVLRIHIYFRLYWIYPSLRTSATLLLFFLTKESFLLRYTNL